MWPQIIVAVIIALMARPHIAKIVNRPGWHADPFAYGQILGEIIWYGAFALLLHWGGFWS